MQIDEKLYFKIGLAVAIPVDNGRGNVYMSYCITSGYSLPTFNDDGVGLDPLPFQTV